MTLNNVPAPILPTDPDSVLGVLARESQMHSRNVNDPNEWIYVGNEGPDADQPWAPDFVNGFSNVGGARCLLRYRFLRPYDPDTTQNAVQLQGSVTGGSSGLTIFTLRIPVFFPDGTYPSPMPAFTPDADILLTCTDDDSDIVVITIKQSGDVVLGVD